MANYNNEIEKRLWNAVDITDRKRKHYYVAINNGLNRNYKAIEEIFFSMY
jgi:guanylate kinase